MLILVYKLCRVLTMYYTKLRLVRFLDLLITNAVNITCFPNMLNAAKNANVDSFTFAASSSTYGFKSIGLRYFNVFGKRQNPEGAYAAVIPKWIDATIKGNEVLINGDGKRAETFVIIDNTVQMNIFAATASEDSKGQVYNVALGDRTTLNELFTSIKHALTENDINLLSELTYREFRTSDVRDSYADVSNAKLNLGYEPTDRISDGILKAMPWYIKNVGEW